MALQKRDGFFHGYYDAYCFLPPVRLFVVISCWSVYLRPSKIDGAKHAWAILALVGQAAATDLAQPCGSFCGADSGFCRHRMLRWCVKRPLCELYRPAWQAISGYSD